MAQNDTQKAQQRAKPLEALKRLDPLVGQWNTEWWTWETPSSEPVKLTGTDTYEWMSGGFFLVHSVNAHMGYGDYKVTEMIGGYEESTQTYPMRSFDSEGNFQTMQASVDDEGVWTFAGEKTKATLIIEHDQKSMTAKWERATDGSNWQKWMDMKFTKAHSTG